MSYAPPGESSFVLFEETTWLQGAMLTSMTYGVATMLFIRCFLLLMRQRTRTNHKVQLSYLIYISVMFFLGTSYCISLFASTQLSFINYRDFPGGPAAYQDTFFSQPIDMLGN